MIGQTKQIPLLSARRPESPSPRSPRDATTAADKPSPRISINNSSGVLHVPPRSTSRSSWLQSDSYGPPATGSILTGGGPPQQRLISTIFGPPPPLRTSS